MTSAEYGAPSEHAAGLGAGHAPSRPDRLPELNAALERALRAGHDTTKIRSDLEAEEVAQRTRRNAEERALRAVSQRLAVERAAAIQATADAISRPIVSNLQAQLKALEPN